MMEEAIYIDDGENEKLKVGFGGGERYLSSASVSFCV